MPTLSICTFCSNPISYEFPLKELILSALPICDEFILINGDNIERDRYDYNLENDSEVEKIINQIYEVETDAYLNKIKIYYNPWEPRMRRNAMVLQKSNAISHCTSDYVLCLDADETLHEEDFSKIKKAMELGHDFYTFRVLHFWRDYDHIIGGENKADPGEQWYKKRPYLFKNNLGIFDGYRYIPEENRCRYTSDLTTWQYEPIMPIIEPFNDC